ncbi:MAG: diaminopimelate epimerase [Armatimonadetes bacterium]|nr:diaminopimelate epimerase [Armatimonadota bacterium]
MKFWKVESIGNHFPLIHLDSVTGATPEEVTDKLSKLSIAMCREHYSIGGDGLLAVGMEGTNVRLRMFNPDGTEDFCGNGIRCAAQHAHEQGWVGTQFNILHLDRTVPVTIDNGLIRSVIGTASYDPKDVPTNIMGELFNVTIFAARVDDWSVVLPGSALSTGSTHVVLPTGSLPDDDGFRKISSMLEHDPRFPKRTSVIWAVQDGDALKIRIWERGVGETFGCGTGSSAAAVDWMRRRGSGGRIEVKNPGGSVWVSADTWHHPITIEGTAKTLFEGDF